MADHEDGGRASRAGHYLEYVTLVDRVKPEEADRHAGALMAKGYAIHFHVWVPEDVRALLDYTAAKLGLAWAIVDALDDGARDEFIYVLRKAA